MLFLSSYAYFLAFDPKSLFNIGQLDKMALLSPSSANPVFFKPLSDVLNSDLGICETNHLVNSSISSYSSMISHWTCSELTKLRDIFICWFVHLPHENFLAIPVSSSIIFYNCFLNFIRLKLNKQMI